MADIIYDFINSKLSEEKRDLKTLVSYPSVRDKALPGAPYGKACADALGKMLEIAAGYGFYTRNVDGYVGTIDLYESGEPKLGILCHLDVVPEGTGWTTPPYTLDERDGKLYGRGSIDDKGPAVCVLYALRAIKESGIKLSHNVRFIVGTDEENGSSDLAYYKSREKLPSLLFTPDGSYPVINFEKGMIRGAFELSAVSAGRRSILCASGGTVRNAVPEKATAKVTGFSEDELKDAAGSLTSLSFEFSHGASDGVTEITVGGKSAHASTPEMGVKAVTGLVRFLSLLKTDDGTAPAFSKIAERFPFGQTDGESLGIKYSDPGTGALTFVFSILSYDGNRITGKFDSRFPLGNNVTGIRKLLENSLSASGITLSELHGVEPHYTDGDSDFVRTLLSVYEKHTGEKGECLAIGGGTYVHEIDGGVAFGAEFPGDENNMHGADEFFAVDSMIKNTAIYADAIINICK